MSTAEQVDPGLAAVVERAAAVNRDRRLEGVRAWKQRWTQAWITH